MTMPSDIEPDVTEAMERTVRPGRPATGGPGSEEIGWVVALLAAFFGVVYGGPALARWRRRPPLKQRLARRAEALRRDARRRAQAAGGRIRRRARRLGGGRL